MTKYYLILEKTLAKGEFEDSQSRLADKAFAFEKGEWQTINPLEINDRLMGYDPTEDDPSHAIGNKSIMDEIREITEEKALRLIAGKNKCRPKVKE